MAMSPTLLRPRRRAAIPPPPAEGSAPSAPTGIILTTAPSPPLSPSLATTPDSPTGVTVETGLVAPTNVGLLAAPKNLTATEVFAPDAPTGLDLTAAPASPTGVQLSVVPSEPTSVTVASVPGSPTGVGLLGSPSNLVVTEGSAPDSPTSVQLTTAPTAPTNPQLTTAPSSPTGVTATGAAAIDPYFTDVTLLLAMDGPDGSTTFTDDSLGSLAFTAFGNAQISTAESKFGGSSALFDGIGDYILSDTTTSALTLGTGDFTIEFWLYPTSTPAGGVLQQTPTSVPAIYINIDSFFGVRIGRHGSNQLDAASNTLTLNAWHHLAFVRSAGTVKIYFDGVSQTVTSTGGGIGGYNFSATKAIEIGRTADSSINGYIDSLRITKAARYTSNFTPPTSAFPATNGDPDFANVSLLLQDSLTDQSLQGQTVVANGDAQISATESKFGGSSIAFDGTGDYLAITDNAALDFTDGSDFTIECWFYRSGTSGVGLFGRGGGAASWSTSNGHYYLGFISSGTLYVQYNYGGGPSVTISLSTTAPSVSTWNHFAMVRSSGTITAYLNGTSFGSSTAALVAPTTRNITRIGDLPSGNSVWNGYIDDFRITKGVARYTSNFTPPTSAFPS